VISMNPKLAVIALLVATLLPATPASAGSMTIPCHEAQDVVCWSSEPDTCTLPDSILGGDWVAYVECIAGL
jgi:hypothetical protein